MGVIEDRLGELGLEIPAPPAAPLGVKLPFEFVRGRHSRSAIGAGELPFGMPVEVEAVVAIA
jgi:hypothetical protein